MESHHTKGKNRDWHQVVAEEKRHYILRSPEQAQRYVLSKRWQKGIQAEYRWQERLPVHIIPVLVISPLDVEGKEGLERSFNSNVLVEDGFLNLLEDKFSDPDKERRDKSEKECPS